MKASLPLCATRRWGTSSPPRQRSRAPATSCSSLRASQSCRFIDTTGPLWAGKLVNKNCSSFALTATAHGGQESTILAINEVFYHWGAIIVAPGYLEPSQFQSGNPYGASHTSSNGTVPPDEIAKTAGRLQGRRVADIAARFAAAR